MNDGEEKALDWNLRPLWRWLTEPSPSTQDPQRRRQARLLASLLVFLIPLSTLSITLQLLAIPDFTPTFTAAAGGILVLILAYGLNRTNRYLPGAVLTVITPSMASLASLIANPADFSAFTFLLLSVVLSSMFLTVLGTVLVAAANVAGIFLLPLLSPAWDYSAILGPASFHVILPALIVLGMRHRDLIERDRQVELAESEQLYHTLFDNAPLGIGIADFDGNIIAFNDAMLRPGGYSRAEMAALKNVEALSTLR